MSPQLDDGGDDMSTTDTLPTYRSEDQLRQLVEIVEVARSVPMSSTVMVHREEVLDILDDVLAHLPDELRAARWLLKEREEFRAKAHREAEEIIADAKSHVARMVQRTEVVKAANQHAQQILDDAEQESRRMMREAEDYCDQKLASFEVVLDRLSKTVAGGRRKLAGTIAETELGRKGGVYDDEADSDAAAFFDQELD
jgi:cell division septum initiation protein DivIVA